MALFINNTRGIINYSENGRRIRVFPNQTCELPLEKGRTIGLTLVPEEIPVEKPVQAFVPEKQEEIHVDENLKETVEKAIKEIEEIKPAPVENDEEELKEENSIPAVPETNENYVDPLDISEEKSSEEENKTVETEEKEEKKPEIKEDKEEKKESELKNDKPKKRGRKKSKK